MECKQNRTSVKLNEKLKKKRYFLKKKSSFLGTALAVSSVVTPALSQTVQAAEDDQPQNSNEQANGSNLEHVTTNQLILGKQAFRSVNTAAFLEEIGPIAQSIAQNNDLYASVMIAQAILESGWGQSALSMAPNYNLFGIKGSYQGASVMMPTKEYIKGKWINVQAAFRKYPSYAESLQDNANVLRNTSLKQGIYYYAGAWKSNTNSYKDATKWLTGRYATDPGYAGKLNRLIETYRLTQYDTPSNGGGNIIDTSTGGGSSTGSETITNGATYTVKAGDTLYRIALNHNISVTQLKSWNHLNGDMIRVGQKLIVGESTQVAPTPAPAQNTDNSSTASNGNYTVKSGDTLYRIAKNHRVSVANIKSWNGLKSDLIYVGQRLVIKGQASTGDQVVNPTTPASTDETVANSTTHTVKSGDTIYGIAKKYQVNINDLKSWNGLKSDLIYIGQRLTIKKAGADNSAVTAVKYRVAKGDTLYRIAKKHHMKVSQLKAINKLDSNMIFAGQTLRLK